MDLHSLPGYSLRMFLDIPYSFLLACLLIEITPGPNMGYLALLTIDRGKKAGIEAVAGVALGLGLMGVIAATGVAQIIIASPLLYQTLRWAGVAFLLYLAYDSWRETSVSASETAPKSRKYFRRGLITNLLNPKAALFYLTVIPTFMDANQAAAPQAMKLTGLYVAIATSVHLSIVFFAQWLRTVLINPQRETYLRRILAGLQVLVAIWLAFTTKL